MITENSQHLNPDYDLLVRARHEAAHIVAAWCMGCGVGDAPGPDEDDGWVDPEDHHNPANGTGGTR